MFSSSFNAQPSIDRLNGRRGAPGGTSGDVMRLGKVQLVPLLENSEGEHAVDVPVVGARLPQTIGQPLYFRRIKQTVKPETFGTECLAQPRLQVTEHPRGDRHQKSLFRTANHFLWKIAQRRLFQQVLRLAVADLEATG